MADRTKTEIEKVQAAPAFIRKAHEDGDRSLQPLREHAELPVIRVVQGQTRGAAKEYGEGAVIIQPGADLVAGPGEEFLVVPVFMWLRFLKRSDRRDKSKPSIVEHTIDPRSDLALRARNRDKRKQQYEGGPENAPFSYSYVEQMNFVCVICDETGMPLKSVATASFERTGLRTGQDWCGAAGMRVVEGMEVPLWAQVWVMYTEQVSNDQGEWYRLVFKNPPRHMQIIGEDYADQYRAFHEKLVKLHADDALDLDTTDEEEFKEAVQAEMEEQADAEM